MCPKCGKRISGANKHKHDGVWYHKQCPTEKTRGQLKREKKNGN